MFTSRQIETASSTWATVNSEAAAVTACCPLPYISVVSPVIGDMLKLVWYTAMRPGARSILGKEAAKVLLGHTKTDTTDIYLLEEVQEAIKVAKLLAFST